MTKIRNNLAIAGIVAACLLLAYVIILSLQLENAELKQERLSEQLTISLEDNAHQSATIKRLAEQRVIDDKIVAQLEKQRQILNDNSKSLQATFKEILDNDAELEKLLSNRLPDPVIRLLDANINTEDGASVSNTTDVTPPELPSTEN